MSNPEKALTTLLGREPTTEELSKIYRMKEQLGLADHDVVWSFLMAFGQYEILYSEFPARIEEAAKTILAEFRVSADAIAQATEKQMRMNVEASVSETVRKLSDQVISTGQMLANNNNRRKILIAVGISLGLATIALTCVLWVGYRLGVSSRDAELAWLDTAPGQSARQFGKINDVSAMLTCSPPLKKYEEKGKTYCMPFDAEKNQVRAWRIE